MISEVISNRAVATVKMAMFPHLLPFAFPPLFQNYGSVEGLAKLLSIVVIIFVTFSLSNDNIGFGIIDAFNTYRRRCLRCYRILCYHHQICCLRFSPIVSQITSASSFKIYRQIAPGRRHLLTGNDIICYFRSAANRDLNTLSNQQI